MILRALALCFLTALPASAQTFQGLLPGMAASELARLGEPLAIDEGGQGLTTATYPLPFNERLRATHDGARILALSSWTEVLAPAPERDGLQAFETTLADAVEAAGSEGWFYEVEGQVDNMSASSTWRMYFDVPDLPEVLLALVFFSTSPAVALEEDAAYQPLPQDADLIQAELFHRDYIRAQAGRFGDIRIDRPDAIPFALPLTEAFPATP